MFDSSSVAMSIVASISDVCATETPTLISAAVVFVVLVASAAFATFEIYRACDSFYLMAELHEIHEKCDSLSPMSASPAVTPARQQVVFASPRYVASSKLDEEEKDAAAPSCSPSTQAYSEAAEEDLQEELIQLNSKVARSVAFCRQLRALNQRLHDDGQAMADEFEDEVEVARTLVDHWTTVRDNTLNRTKQWEEYYDYLVDRLDDADAMIAESETVIEMAEAGALQDDTPTGEDEEGNEVTPEMLRNHFFSESKSYLIEALQELWADADDLYEEIADLETENDRIAHTVYNAENEERLAEIDEQLCAVEDAEDVLAQTRAYIVATLEAAKDLSSAASSSALDETVDSELEEHSPSLPMKVELLDSESELPSETDAYLSNKHAMLHQGPPQSAVATREPSEAGDAVVDEAATGSPAPEQQMSASKTRKNRRKAKKDKRAVSSGAENAATPTKPVPAAPTPSPLATSKLSVNTPTPTSKAGKRVPGTPLSPVSVNSAVAIAA